MMLTLH